MSKAAELAKWGEVSTNGQVSGRRNIVINGAMKVAQRGTSQTGITASANEGYVTVDRFSCAGASHAGVLTMTQTADGPSGFANCIKLDCTTADTSIAAGEYLFLATTLEGQDVQQFKKGTSDAEQFTVSFYVKGNANAVYTLELLDNDNGRQISKTFAVTSSWNRIILTYPADTTGAFDDDNAGSFGLYFYLHSGATYNSGTLNSTAWASTTAANRMSSDATSFFDSTDRTFFLTGLQLEVGSVATPFEHRSFGEELALCRRYYHSDKPADLSTSFATGHNYNSGIGLFHKEFTVPMRAAPSVSVSDVAHFAKDGGARSDAITSLSTDGFGFYGGTIRGNSSTSTASAGSSLSVGDVAAEIKFDAEL